MLYAQKIGKEKGLHTPTQCCKQQYSALDIIFHVAALP